MSSKPLAAYIYCPPKKNYNFEQMIKYLSVKVTDATMDPRKIQEVYADGWEDIPNGLGELIADASKYSLIILYSLEGVDINDISALIEAGCSVYCTMAPYAGIVEKVRSDGFRALKTTIEAKEYYKNLRSLNIRVGMKNTNKHVGKVPFGHERKEDGTLTVIPEKMHLVETVRQWYTSGMPVMEIAERTEGELSARQVIGLMSVWGVESGD